MHRPRRVSIAFMPLNWYCVSIISRSGAFLGGPGGLMIRTKRKAIAVMAAAIAVVGLLGASLGMAFANTTTLSKGFNLVGGPLRSDTAPAAWVSCLPSGSWNAIYVWDTTHQHWLHFFNTDSANVPGYVNQPAAGGIVTIPKLAGVALIMNQAVPGATLADSPAQACNS